MKYTKPFYFGAGLLSLFCALILRTVLGNLGDVIGDSAALLFPLIVLIFLLYRDKSGSRVIKALIYILPILIIALAVILNLVFNGFQGIM